MAWLATQKSLYCNKLYQSILSLNNQHLITVIWIWDAPDKHVNESDKAQLWSTYKLGASSTPWMLISLTS